MISEQLITTDVLLLMSQAGKYKKPLSSEHVDLWEMVQVMKVELYNYVYSNTTHDTRNHVRTDCETNYAMHIDY